MLRDITYFLTPEYFINTINQSLHFSLISIMDSHLKYVSEITETMARAEAAIKAAEMQMKIYKEACNA